jgi:tetratricopeptide (TPR) repeat protein
LEAKDNYVEALELYAQALAAAPHDLRALHGSARCWLGTGEFSKAISALESVLEQDRAYRDYGAALDYAEALWQAGRREDAVELMEGLAKHTGRANHVVGEAHYRQQAGDLAGARRVLEELLANQSLTSAAGQRKWLERAQVMLREMESPAQGASKADPDDSQSSQ